MKVTVIGAGNMGSARKHGLQNHRCGVRLMHRQEDRVMLSALSIDAVGQLQALGATATLDRFPHLDHGVDGRVLERLAQRMQEGVTP